MLAYDVLRTFLTDLWTFHQIGKSVGQCLGTIVAIDEGSIFGQNKRAMERLQEYLDGELNGVSHEEVAHHFSQCQRCYPHLQLEERFKDLLHRSQEAETCPDRVRSQVLELLATEADGSD